MDEPASSLPLPMAVANWLEREGYPVEFYTANIFKEHDFLVRQGEHVEDPVEKTKREIDVMATFTARHRDGFIRIVHLVECKWSEDKPWVIFTSPTTRMASRACICQTIGSSMGRALTYLTSKDTRVRQMKLFDCPAEGGFGGKQAFSKGKDLVYETFSAVVGNSINYAAWYDERREVAECRDIAVLIFPLIVVKGALFRATYDEAACQMKLDEVKSIRCHWRGSRAQNLISTLDIVTTDGLGALVEQRKKETKELVEILLPLATKVSECCHQRSLAPLADELAGEQSLPGLLREISALYGS